MYKQDIIGQNLIKKHKIHKKHQKNLISLKKCQNHTKLIKNTKSLKKSENGALSKTTINN